MENSKGAQDLCVILCDHDVITTLQVIQFRPTGISLGVLTINIKNSSK